MTQAPKGWTEIEAGIERTAKPPNHTPGPWSICYDGQIDAANGDFICSFRWDSFKEFNEDKTHQANARLIAAAPRLLWCLEELLEHIEWRRRVAGETAGEQDCTHRARAAVAKATGGAV